MRFVPANITTSDNQQNLKHKVINSLTNYVDSDAVHQQFFNNSGGVLAPGVAVVNTQWNTVNNSTEVVKARANSGTTCPCHGLVEATTDNNATGEIRTHGILVNVDTSAWSEGADLWLSPTTAGVLTTTMPVAVGQYQQFIGTVIRQNATVGQIAVNIGPAILIQANTTSAITQSQQVPTANVTIDTNYTAMTYGHLELTGILSLTINGTGKLAIL